MYASNNTLTMEMMSKFDSYFQSDNFPCEEQNRDCDIQIAGDIVYGRDELSAFAGPDDYVFDYKTFPFMLDRYYSCELSYFKVPMGKQLMAYGISKNAPYKNEVNSAIMRLWETGLVAKLMQDYYPHPPDCSELTASAYKPVSIFFVLSAYFILGFGYKSSILIFIVEVCYYKLIGSVNKNRKFALNAIDISESFHQKIDEPKKSSY